MSRSYDAIIIGGGAAGLFCALTAGRRGKRVLVIEHNAEVGRKIIISGGGRCNFTNTSVTAENFVSQNPHFAKSALSRYTPQDFIDLVRSHHIAYYEKTLGQLFCRDSSRQIVEMLLDECRKAKVQVQIETSCAVAEVRDAAGFEVETSKATFSAESLVVASGGLSFSKIGATDFGYRIARQFGLKTVETRPSLVALVAKDRDWQNLAGIAVRAEVASGGATFRENILFTHRGMSGPAVLQISNYWKPGRAVTVDFIPDTNRVDFIDAASQSRQQASNFLSQMIPAKLAQRIGEKFGQKEIKSIGSREIDALADTLKCSRVLFSSTEGYDRAEVTLGGVSTDELSSQTMESKRCKGLYFIGEVVDVTGWLGGYNFQWAWSSGHACGAAL